MQKQADRWMKRAATATLVFTALFAAEAAVAAETPPPLPYYTVQLGTAGNKSKALAEVKSLGDEPAARAEKRAKGYVVRFGAWADRGPADAGLARHKAGHKEAKVMLVTKPSDWLLASGETVSPAATAKTAAPAAAPAENETAAPAEAVAPAPAAPAVAVQAPPAPVAPAPVSADDFHAMATQLDAALRQWVQHGVARSDGYTYGMDIAALLQYAAQRKDAALYEQLAPAARALVVQGDDAATKGFVLWRHKDGVEPEVSGATEALWMARALWNGSKAFKKPDDRALALQVLDGYARHAHGEQASWHVSKYYAFGTKSFAPLSVLPNYDPDFVAETEPLASPKVRGLARKSYSLLQRAVTPSKLLVPIVQPALNELLPGVGVNLYAPNNIVVLEDSCGAAESAQRGVPQLAKNVLEFAGKSERLDANGRLHAYYHRKDGHAIGDTVLSTSGYACLARLAVALKDRKALPPLKSVLAGDMQALLAAPEKNDAPLYGAAALLRTADALKAL